MLKALRSIVRDCTLGLTSAIGAMMQIITYEFRAYILRTHYLFLEMTRELHDMGIVIHYGNLSDTI